MSEPKDSWAKRCNCDPDSMAMKIRELQAELDRILELNTAFSHELVEYTMLNTKQAERIEEQKQYIGSMANTIELQDTENQRLKEEHKVFVHEQLYENRYEPDKLLCIIEREEQGLKAAPPQGGSE